ncbi:MAG: hypothetical protein PSV13_17700 [Lacunisphaera sp.]|nr:hypothetical protein [Lacunisphaera sp.]
MRSHADRQPTAQLKLPRLRFVWKPLSAADARWRLGLLGHCFKETPRRLFVYVSLRGLLLWGTGATLAAYLLGTAALAWLWGRNPYNHVTYADLALPTRWSELRAKRGQGLIDEGIHEARAGRYGSGLMLLRRGVSQKPADARGRQALAELFIGLGYLHRGLQLMEEGLDYGPPPRAAREKLLRLTGYLEDYERVLALTDRIEQVTPPEDKATRRWLLAERVTALERLHRYDEIERLRDAQAAAPTIAVESAWARTQAVRGRPADALRAIARDPGRFGLPAERCQLQLTLAIAARDRAAADAAIRDWLKVESTNPLPRAEEITALIQLGDAVAARDRLQRYFLHFSTEKPAVILLMKKLSGLPDVSWLQAAHQEAADAGALSIEARILYVQGLLMAGKVSAALTEFNLTTALIDQAKIKDGGWSEGTRRLLNVILSDSPSDRSLFLAFFRNTRLTPEAYRFALRSLRSASARELAGELSIVARNRFPALQDAALDPEPATDVMKPEETPAMLFHTEAEARMELRRIDAEIQAGNHQPAFVRLKAVERAGHPALQPEILLRRIQVHGALREQAELAGALQLYLSRPEANQAWLRQLADNWSGGPQRESALTVARETAAKFPEARWARDKLGASAGSFTLPTEKTAVVVRNEAEARAELRRIDAELAAGKHHEALERIKAVERAKIAAVQPELLLRRIQAHGALSEQVELAAALGYYLSGKTVDLSALRTLALQWDNDKQRDSALSVTREVLGKFPQARWAQELRKKIEGDLLVAPGENLLEGKKP